MKKIFLLSTIVPFVVFGQFGRVNPYFHGGLLGRFWLYGQQGSAPVSPPSLFSNSKQTTDDFGRAVLPVRPVPVNPQKSEQVVSEKFNQLSKKPVFYLDCWLPVPKTKDPLQDKDYKRYFDQCDNLAKNLINYYKDQSFKITIRWFTGNDPRNLANQAVPIRLRLPSQTDVSSLEIELLNSKGEKYKLNDIRDIGFAGKEIKNSTYWDVSQKLIGFYLKEKNLWREPLVPSAALQEEISKFVENQFKLYSNGQVQGIKNLKIGLDEENNQLLIITGELVFNPPSKISYTFNFSANTLDKDMYARLAKSIESYMIGKK